MPVDTFRDEAVPNSHHFKELRWEEGRLKACIGTPYGDLNFDRSELLAQPFRSIPTYHSEALSAIEAVIAPLFETLFIQGKNLLYATVLRSNLFEFRFMDWQRRVVPDGKHFQITRQEASEIYAYCTENGHITRASANRLSGGTKQTLRKNLVTLGFLCRTEKAARLIFWNHHGSDKIIVPGAERIEISRSSLSAIYKMDTEAARPYVQHRFTRRPWSPPPLEPA